MCCSGCLDPLTLSSGCGMRGVEVDGVTWSELHLGYTGCGSDGERANMREQLAFECDDLLKPVRSYPKGVAYALSGRSRCSGRVGIALTIGCHTWLTRAPHL